MRNFFIGFVFLFLVGCAVRYYNEPTSGPSSKITIKNMTSNMLLMINFKDVEKCTDPAGISPQLEYGESRTINVKANVKEVWVFQSLKVGSLGSKLASISCLLMPSFTLESNENYELIVSETESSCYLQIKNTKSKEILIPIMRTYRIPFVESGGFCEPQ